MDTLFPPGSYWNCLTAPLFLLFVFVYWALGGSTLLMLAERLALRLAGRRLGDKDIQILIFVWIVLNSLLFVWLAHALGK